jgi:hemerythrin superfamily protein
MDAITLLKNDHREVEQLFKRFEKAGPGALVEKRRVVDGMIEALSVHAAIEEQVFYPAVREAVPKAGGMVLESLEEHHVAKWVLSELDGMDPKAERFDAKVTVLMETVRHHVREEEEDLFPQVRSALGRARLNELGDAMDATKRIAPTRPHPRSPDTPPGNVVAGVAAGALDRARRVGKEAVEAVERVTTGAGARPVKKRATKKKAAKKAVKARRKTAAKATKATKKTAKKATGSATKATKATKKATKKATGTKKRATAKKATKRKATAKKTTAKKR